MKPVIIIGAGGHTKVLIDTLQGYGRKIEGITDIDAKKRSNSFSGIPIIGEDNVILDYNPESVSLINGLGMVGRTSRRREIYDYFKGCGYQFDQVIHPSAILSPKTELSEGVQIMAGAIIQPGSRIGHNSIINTGAIIDHDAAIGSHVHVAPGVTISGGVSIGDGSLIGTGATVIQGVKISANCIIAAGSVVIRDVAEGTTIMGIPARVVNR
ncbi:MAG: acetyltransferase [Deltaproteobacteria bacterium]